MITTEYAQALVTALAAIAALGAALAWAYRKVVKPVAEAVDAIRDVVDLQLKPNGGGSLVDKVNRIAPNHADAQKHWETLEATTGTIVKRLDKIEMATAMPKDVP